ncbi:MurR/RpiR family transcriptional regulator [Kineococcus sp. SYSU DK003]|uniref:MurR/RpiR family transcriptional regulator n=1 Tax=Kineococcus sp. SYSU DK003 TaxID=3383124 RepID=UPI003D7D898B
MTTNTAATSTADPVQRILAVQSELPPSLRKVADFVLRHPDLVERCSAAELARRAGTSQAAVTRFCQTIGLEGYQGLVLLMAREQGRRSGDGVWGTAEIGPDIGPDDDLERVAAVVAAADVRSLQDTARRLDLDAVEKAAQAVARARRVDVYGVGGSAAMAAETDARLFGIGVPVRNWTEVHAATTSAALLTAADVAIAISVSGATREVVEPAELAVRRGATTVAVTGDPASPLARLADVVLTAAPGGTTFREGPFAARHGQLLVVDCLYVRVAQLTFSRASAARALTDHIPGDHVVRRSRRRTR